MGHQTRLVCFAETTLAWLADRVQRARILWSKELAAIGKVRVQPHRLPAYAAVAWRGIGHSEKTSC